MRGVISQISLIAQITGGSIVALALNLVLARDLSLAEYGSYVLAMSVGAITCWGAICGYDVIAARRAQEWEKDPETRRAFTLAGQVMILLASLLMAAIVWVIWFVAYRPVLPAIALALVCVLTPLLASTRFFAAILTGIGRPQRGQAPERFMRDGIPLAIVFGLYLSGMGVGNSVFALLLITVGASTALALTAFLAGRAGFFPSVDLRAARSMAEGLWPAAFKLTLLALGQLLLTRLNLLILGRVEGLESAGLYGAVLNLSEIGGFPALAMSLLYAPTIARAYRERQNPLKTVSNARRTTLLMIMPIILFSLFFGGDGMILLFGHGYEAGHFALVILLGTHAVRAIALFPQLILSLTDGEKVALRCVGAALVLEAVLGTTLILLLGMIGAALGTLISTIATQLVLRIALSRHFEQTMTE